jgi:hypothetical protein
MSPGKPSFGQEPSVHFPESVPPSQVTNFGWQQRITTGVNRLLTVLQRSGVKDRTETTHTFPMLFYGAERCPTSIQLLIDHQLATEALITYVKEGSESESVSVEVSDLDNTLFLSYYPADNPLVIPGELIPRNGTAQEKPVEVKRDDFQRWLKTILSLGAPEDMPLEEVHYRSPFEIASSTTETHHYLTPGGLEVIHAITSVFGSQVGETFSIEYGTGTPGRTIVYTQTQDEIKFHTYDDNLLEAHQELSADDGDLRRLAEILEDESKALGA